MSTTRMFCASVLFFESIIVALAIPVALGLTAANPAAIGWGFGVLAIACLLCAGLLGRSWGIPLGWVLQGLILLTGLIVPAMIVLGVIFTVLWGAAVHYGRRVDAIKAVRAAQHPS